VLEHVALDLGVPAGVAVLVAEAKTWAAVCRCLGGADSSSRRIWSMAARTGSSFGAGRSLIAATGSGCLRAFLTVTRESPISRAICRMALPSRRALLMAP
jgi:hypothetical protein